MVGDTPYLLATPLSSSRMRFQSRTGGFLGGGGALLPISRPPPPSAGPGAVGGGMAAGKLTHSFHKPAVAKCPVTQGPRVGPVSQSPPPPRPGRGLLLTTRHHWGGGGHTTPPPPKVGPNFFRAFGQSKNFFGAFGQFSLDQILPAAPLKTQPHGGGGGHPLPP